MALVVVVIKDNQVKYIDGLDTEVIVKDEDKDEIIIMDFRNKERNEGDFYEENKIGVDHENDKVVRRVRIKSHHDISHD